MADTDWIAFWAERGVTIEAGTDKALPGNGFVPPFSIERAEALGVKASDADVMPPGGEAMTDDAPVIDGLETATAADVTEAEETTEPQPE